MDPSQTTLMKTNWKLVALLCATATAGYVCRVNVSTAGALMMDTFHLSQVDMGWIFSSFLAGYALFQIPSGMLADRFGTKRVLAIATILWFTLTVLQSVWGWTAAGSATTFIVLLMATRFLLGVTASPTYPASALGVSRWIPFQAQGRANGIVIGSVGLGSALAPPLVSYVMVHWGWPLALVVSALPVLVVAFLWRKVQVPDPVAPIAQDVSTPSTTTQNLFNRRFILLTISYSLQGYVGYIFVSWFYLYLVQVRGFSLLSGAWMSSLPWVLSIVSIPLGGWVSDRLIAKMGTLWGSRVVPIVGMAASGILIAIGAYATNPVVAALTLTFATAFVLCVEGPFWAMMSRVAGTRTGTAGGIMNMGSNLGGLVSPLLTPWMATFLGWEGALLIAGGLAVVAAGCWLGVRE